METVLRNPETLRDAFAFSEMLPPLTQEGVPLSEKCRQLWAGGLVGRGQPRTQATPDPLLPTSGASILLYNALGAPHLSPTSRTPVTCQLVHPRSIPPSCGLTTLEPRIHTHSAVPHQLLGYGPPTPGRG